MAYSIFMYIYRLYNIIESFISIIVISDWQPVLWHSWFWNFSADLLQTWLDCIIIWHNRIIYIYIFIFFCSIFWALIFRQFCSIISKNSCNHITLNLVYYCSSIVNTQSIYFWCTMKLVLCHYVFPPRWLGRWNSPTVTYY